MTSECADYNDTVELGSLLRHVSPSVNNIPYELGIELLRQVYQDFARRTEFLACRQDIVMQKGVSDYEIFPPEGYEFYKARGVERGSEFYAMPDADYWYPMWGTELSVIGTKYVVFRNTPSRDEPEPYRFVYTVVPTECVTRVPREISLSFGDKIGKGVLAEVLRYTNKPWYNPSLADKMEKKYEIGVQSARNLVLSNRGAASRKARTRRWV